MAKIVWDETGKKFFETGVEKGVLYVRDNAGAYPLGVAWNGLISVSESPSGGEPEAVYADNIKYANVLSTEEFGASIEAYTYPDEFAVCDGSAEVATGVLAAQQGRSAFGLAYTTKVGNDVDGQDHGYKLHLIYGALAAPSEKSYQTMNESPDLVTFSWDLSTTPVAVTGFKPTANLTLDSRKVEQTKLDALELILFGDVATEARLPLPDEVLSILAAG